MTRAEAFRSLELAIESLPWVDRAWVGDGATPGLTVVAVRSRRGCGAPVALIRDSTRDAMLDHLPTGASWLVSVDQVLAVVPAAMTIVRSEPYDHLRGDRVSHDWRQIERVASGQWLTWSLVELWRRATWWSRTDQHVVHRSVSRGDLHVVELERLRWDWEHWTWVRAST